MYVNLSKDPVKHDVITNYIETSQYIVYWYAMWYSYAILFFIPLVPPPPNLPFIKIVLWIHHETPKESSTRRYMLLYFVIYGNPDWSLTVWISIWHVLVIPLQVKNRSTQNTARKVPAAVDDVVYRPVRAALPWTLASLQDGSPPPT